MGLCKARRMEFMRLGGKFGVLRPIQATIRPLAESMVEYHDSGVWSRAGCVSSLFSFDRVSRA